MNTSPIPAKCIGALHGTPLCPHVLSYVGSLRQEGYRTKTVIAHVYLFRRLASWLARTGRALSELSESELAQFLEGRPHDAHDGAPQALQRLLQILRRAHVTAPAAPIVRTPAQSIADEYRTFLRVERSFGTKTVETYGRYIERFLTDSFGKRPVDLRALKLSDVMSFVRRTASLRGKIYVKGLVIALRSFLRYLRYCGKIEADWATSIPAVAHWRLAGLPKRLPAEAVERILNACSQSSALGRRDHAILLLLARLGLRGCEVVRMQLDDIDWANARITVRSQKGRGWARMPLPADVGRAIALYLRKDRRACACRNLFVRSVAPHAPLNNSAVIGLRVRAAMKRAGVESARKGAHVFRHSLASEMLCHGATLEEIAQVLRHKDHDTTAIYAKVDLRALRRLVVPLPGGAA